MVLKNLVCSGLLESEPEHPCRGASRIQGRKQISNLVIANKD